MRSTLLSFERHASRFAAAALLGTAVTAPAWAESKGAPAPTVAAPTKPSEARYLPTGILIWKVVNISQMLLGGATFRIDGGPNNIQWVMPDNNGGDMDLVNGQFKFAGVAPGSYQVCEITPPAGYAVSSANCKSAIVNAGAITDVGAFMNGSLPWVSQSYVDYAKTPVGGGTYSVKDSLGTTIMTILDNSVQDIDKTAGKFTFQLPSSGRFTICELKPPPGWYFPAGQANLCVTRTFALNTGGNYGDFMVVPPYSAVWSVISGWTGPLNKSPLWLGPSTYIVSNINGSFSTTFVDNGPGDLHNMQGIFYVKLPSAGTYNVCQAAEVPGYFMPNPACHQVVVTFATVGWGDFFLNQEKQVPNIP